jgi:hypothetical protein
MATTTNYSWSTPDDTALVKDGAAAIRTLGSSADTTVKALNPGTTAGDIDYYTTSTTKARIGIGTAGQILKVNSGATAPEWGAPTFSGVFVRQSAATTSISNNTNTTVLFDTEEFDTDAYHSTSTNTSRITIPAGKAGKYAINSAFFFQENANGARVLNIHKNGSNYARSQMPPNSVSQIAVTLNLVMDLAVNDYIEVVVFQNSGGSLNLYGGSAPIQGLFSAYLIGV